MRKKRAHLSQKLNGEGDLVSPAANTPEKRLPGPSVATDLLGAPIHAAGSRETVPHVRTARTRTRVEMLLALCWTQTRIADALGISVGTLRRRYGAELDPAAAGARLEADRLEALWARAAAGNVAAIKAFGRELDHAARQDQPSSMPPDPARRRGSQQGMQNAAAKLTDRDVLAILRSYTGVWGEQSKLAKRYGVTPQNINLIVRRLHWRHLDQTTEAKENQND
jgi:hypothetical protein